MREIEAENAVAYLREAGRLPSDTAATARELAGGVSNVVILVEINGAAPIVLKQSRERLRTASEWRSRLDRIWTEREALGLLDRLVPGSVPVVLFDEPADYLFAMSCAPEGSVTWKSRLMAGIVEPEIAAKAGRFLGTVHTGAVDQPALGGRLADRSLFDELRLDPYYRTAARAHPDLAQALTRLAGPPEVGRRPTLVLGDYSPKNLLVDPAGTLTAVDFETAHAGDPAFDLGFFASHLLMKAFRAAQAAGRAGLPGPDAYLRLLGTFIDAYQESIGDDGGELTHRAVRHAAACCLARVDGKSPVEYRDELNADAVRRLARVLLLGTGSPAAWADLAEIAAREMH